jgi:6-pyruvoyltetrahydropterin/6-carboxytetrahydropterin synthase
MEMIRAQGSFHAAHRQLGYEGKCVNVHGHTWKGIFEIRAEYFPRDESLDMSVDFGALKDIFKSLDHKMLVSSADAVFLNSSLFDPSGVVVLPGKNPSVENVALYCMDEAVELLKRLFPGRGVDYSIELTIRETENNSFVLDRRVTV